MNADNLMRKEQWDELATWSNYETAKLAGMLLALCTFPDDQAARGFLDGFEVAAVHDGIDFAAYLERHRSLMPD